MINDSTKRELWKSGEGRCARCGRPLVYEETVIDHIFPKSLGGADHIDNLRLLCKQCNSKLSNRAYFSEYAFKEYLKQFLDQDVRFEMSAWTRLPKHPMDKKYYLTLHLLESFMAKKKCLLSR